MDDVLFYLIVGAAALIGISAAVADRRRRRSMPPRSPRARWLAVRMSIGATLFGLSIMPGAVMLIFALGYLNASDAGRNNHRDSLIVIISITSMMAIGAGLYFPAKRELNQLERDIVGPGQG